VIKAANRRSAFFILIPPVSVLIYTIPQTPPSGNEKNALCRKSIPTTEGKASGSMFRADVAVADSVPPVVDFCP
jgi:hypothetical protein